MLKGKNVRIGYVMEEPKKGEIMSVTIHLESTTEKYRTTRAIKVEPLPYEKGRYPIYKVETLENVYYVLYDNN